VLDECFASQQHAATPLDSGKELLKLADVIRARFRKPRSTLSGGSRLRHNFIRGQRVLVGSSSPQLPGELVAGKVARDLLNGAAHASTTTATNAIRSHQYRLSLEQLDDTRKSSGS
jgi:hypothetical protein